jgi:membrane-bound serine protease (ClpP class)
MRPYPSLALVSSIFRSFSVPALFLVAASFAHPFSESQPLVEKIEIRDTIQPISAGRLTRAIQTAGHDHAAALLVELDTPGGLLSSTRDMVGAILSSPVPVILYVSPAGVRAASAGFFLLESADVAAMAAETNTGAAHPVLESGTPDPVMKMKMENDAAAFLRSYSTRRGHNTQLAESAIRESKSFSADEALDQHLIDIISPDETQLLDSLDGRKITRLNQGNPTTQTLHLKNAKIVTLQPSLRDEILGHLANPNIAILLLVGGALLIYLEFNVPGTIVPGAIGTVMVLVSIFALDLLPIRHTAVLLLLAAAVLMVLELKFPSHGILFLVGIACLAFGTLTLVDSPIPELAIQPTVAISICIAFGLITFLLLRVALAARRNKALTGPAALIGAFGTSMEPLWSRNTLPIGHILVQGEIWQATAHGSIPEKESVRVIGFHDDVLEVTAEAKPAPRA